MPPGRPSSKARAISGPEATVGAACGSDAFYPFPDAVEACLAAGVTAFAQPGGSVRDDDVIAVAEAAGAAMVLTGTPPLPPLTRAGAGPAPPGRSGPAVRRWCPGASRCRIGRQTTTGD